MIDFHIKKSNAKLTDCDSQKVPLEEAHRFGIMETNSSSKIIGFEEKPKGSLNLAMHQWVFMYLMPKLI